MGLLSRRNVKKDARDSCGVLHHLSGITHLMLRSCVIALVLLLVPLEAHAQFVVESSTPALGATGVASTATVRFTFSDDVSTKTNWNTAFVVEPQDAVEIQQANLLLDDEGQTAVVEYEVTHAPDTDVTWLVYAVEKEGETEASPWVEPYVLRYTTAASAGRHRVRGAVRASAASLATPAVKRRASSAAGPSRPAWARLVRMAAESGLGAPVFDAPSDDGAKQTSSANDGDPPDVTSVFLLEHFTASERGWAVRGGAVIEGSAGAYEMTHVRSGTYWPLAVRYADRARTEIEALGFYDADGDGAPDPITVDGSGRAGVDLTLAPFPRTTAREHRTAAQAAAEAVADDARLVSVRADASADADGTAYTWTYQYHVPSLDREALVTVDPLGTRTQMQAAFDYVTTMAPVPASFIDSDAALQAVLDDGGQALADACPPGDLHVAVEAGNLYWLVPYPTTRVIWRVRLEGNTGASAPGAETCNQVVERYLDVETGEVLDASALPVELVAFEAQADGSDVTLRWRTAAEMDNAGFEVQGRKHGAAAWEPLGFVEGAGTTRAPQTYRYRVHDLMAGTHRFRLRQVDLNGADTYSAEVEAQIALAGAFVVEAPYPNPTSGRATLRIGRRGDGGVRVALFDALGRRVRTIHAEPVSGGSMQTLVIDTRRLASGRYYVRAVTQDGRHVRVHPLTVLR